MEKYKPIKPTKSQVACNAIRAMFFDKTYNGVIPVKDLEVVNNSSKWHRVYGKKPVQQSIKELISDGYINLDSKKENWLWGGDMHNILFEKKH